MKQLVFIAIGGSIGAILRYILSTFINKLNLSSFILGTLMVNVIGCFLAGITFAYFEKNIMNVKHLELFFITGILGAFTTFSAYGIECAKYIEAGNINHMILNILVTNILGLAMVFLGIYIGKSIWS